jgi:hypothetical protein
MQVYALPHRRCLRTEREWCEGRRQERSCYTVGAKNLGLLRGLAERLAGLVLYVGALPWTTPWLNCTWRFRLELLSLSLRLCLAHYFEV